ncbi:WD40 repeat domain-containing protein, partial [Streptosporangium vulgare]
WDVATGKQIGTPLTGHTHWVWAVAFSPDGKRLASSGGYDKTVRIWDAATGKQIGPPLTGHTSEVSLVAFSPDGTRLATTADKEALIWNVALPRDPHGLLREVCVIAGRSLTRQEWQQYIPTEPYRPSCPAR